jgi:hypothetical protein
MNSSDSSANSEHSEAPEKTSSGDTGQSSSLWRKAKELLKDERVQKAKELLKDERVQAGIGVAAAAAVAVTRSIVKAKSEPTGKSASMSSSKLNFLMNLVDEFQQAHSKRQTQQAEDHYNLALEADPNNVEAKNNLQQAQRSDAQQVQQAARDELKGSIKPSYTLTDFVNSQPWRLPPKF